MSNQDDDTVGVHNDSSNDGIDRWIADSGATFHMTESVEMLRDLQPSEEKVKIDNNTLIDVECYGSLTVVFRHRAGVVTVRLEKIAYVPDLAFNLFSLVAAYTRGVGLSTDD
ncbi:unnamed protein product, partial [Sphacelaria rigidula]